MKITINLFKKVEFDDKDECGISLVSYMESFIEIAIHTPILVMDRITATATAVNRMLV